VAGVLAGFALAVLAGRDARAVLVLLALCLFCMFWARAYWAFTFHLTASVFLVTLLQHAFSVSLLSARVEETALGVAVAALTGMILLPNPDRRASDERLATLLDTMTCVADHAAERPADPTRGTLAGEVLALDRAWEAFRASSGPVAHTLNPDSAPRIRTRRLLVTAEIATYHARNLALLARAPGVTTAGVTTAGVTTAGVTTAGVATAGVATTACVTTTERVCRGGGQPAAKPCGARRETARRTAISALALEPGLPTAPAPVAERIAHHTERLAAASATLRDHLSTSHAARPRPRHPQIAG
jgi:uncharacterized membrane protein YccC